MLQTTFDAKPEQGVVDFSLARSSSWASMPAFAGDVNGAGFVLIGDRRVGPFFTFSSMSARSDALPLAPAHSHGSGSWRCSVRGLMSMGRGKYGPGEFRFQVGGRPYGRSDVAWGPEGGWSTVVFGDRRGFLPRYTDKNVATAGLSAEDSMESANGLCRELGIEYHATFPGDVDVDTTIGAPGKGGVLEGSFHDTASWTPVGDGTQLALAVFGDREAGPVLLLVHAGPGASAFPATHLDTEVLHMIVRGSARVGERELVSGDIRIVQSAVAHPALVAEAEGVDDAVFVGDRRALLSALTDGALEDRWAEAIGPMLEALSLAVPQRQLSRRPPPGGGLRFTSRRRT